MDGADAGMSPKQHQRRHSPDDPLSTLRASNQSALPDGWKGTTLGALGHPSSGGTPSRSDSRFWGGDIPWISSKDMKAARLHDSLEHVTPLALGNGTKLVQPGTILMVVRGMSLAHSFPVAIVEEPVAFNQDLKAFVPNNDVDGEYILRWLQANQSRLLSLATEATHGTKRIPTNDLLAIDVVLPQLLEQREIAIALSDMDGFLGAMEALIAKKRAIIQSVMDQILTGKYRLPDFKGLWKPKRLGDVGTFSKGQGIRRDDVSQEGYPCIRYGEIYTKYENYVSDPLTRIPLTVAESALPIQTGDILFAGSGETAEEIGRCVAFLGDGQAYAGGDIVVLTPVGQDSLYLGYLLNHSTVSMQKARMAQGDAVVHISAANLGRVQISLPPVEEQTAIASVLCDMDSEIALLEGRRDKIRDIKRGMLQQLLTGRIRLAKDGGISEREGVRGAVARKHNWQFNEAVAISVLARKFGTERFPLGRVRYTKLLYLLHRHKEGRAEGYLKKASGPYNPRTRYGGPERIAVEKKYIRRCKSGTYRGFVADSLAGEAERYFHKWYGTEALQWLEQFRYKKNDELELLTTVDMAAEELRAAGKEVSVENVKDVILGHREWKAKMDRRIFADANVSRSIEDSRTLFAVGSERDTA